MRTPIIQTAPHKLKLLSHPPSPTPRLSSINPLYLTAAYNLYDGLVMAKKYEAGVSSNPPAKLHKIYADRLTRAVRRIPDPLAFFGYVFCFTAFFAGPAFEFAEYERSVAESDFKDRSSGKLDLRWGSRLSAAFKKLVIGLAFLVSGVGCGAFGGVRAAPRTADRA